ncbi:MAG: iron uptake transporter permease EfeU [Thermoleophilia bacterium]
MSGFVITLREGIEAALIIGLVLAAVRKAGAVGMLKYVWYGVASAVAVSAVAGAALVAVLGYLPDEAAEVFEGVASLVAVGVLTFMIFWMRVQGSRLGREIDDKVSAAAGIGSGFALWLLAFAAVSREGLETVLFMFAAFTSAGALATTLGGLAGLVVAVALGYVLYRGSLKLDIRAFFRATGALIVVLAAGMLAYGLHELQEVGLMPTVVEHLWDMNGVLNEKAGVGAFLKALLGYNGNPSLIEVVAYWTYLIVVGWLFIRPQSSVATVSRPVADGAH